jgi:hypothetical protein
VLRFQPLGLGSGTFDMGGWDWVWSLIASALLIWILLIKLNQTIFILWLISGFELLNYQRTHIFYSASFFSSGSFSAVRKLR